MWQAWQRRTLLRGSLTLALAGLLPGTARALLQATPAQTEGPFYPRDPSLLPLDRDNDLLRLNSVPLEAMGTPLHLVGQVLSRDGAEIEGARVEIWQCDAAGVYRHPNAPQAGMDPGFQGYGYAITDPTGHYRFRTIRPVAYPGRTPHIHFKVTAAGLPGLTTQMYVAGEPLNQRDGIYRSLGDDAALVTVALTPVPDLEPGALTCRFDLVLA